MLRNSETKNRWKRRKKNEIAKTSRIVDFHCMIYGQAGFLYLSMKWLQTCVSVREVLSQLLQVPSQLKPIIGGTRHL